MNYCVERCTTGIAAISWINTCRTPHNEGPQPADALPLLGGNSLRAAALRGEESGRNHERRPAAQETVVSKHSKIRMKDVSPPPQNDMN